MGIASTRAFRITAVLGFLGVALGAFGAHALKEVFAARPAAQILWEKAILYHFVHTVVMLLVACLKPFQFLPWLLFCCGIVLFSGSLYLLALTDLRWLGIVTPPLGGSCFLAGWLWLAFGRRTASLAP